MLEAIMAGEEDAPVLALALRRLRQKLPALREALTGRVLDHPRFLLRRPSAQIDCLAEAIAQVQQEFEQRLVKEEAAAVRL
jgi:hypothetical protein